MNKHRLFGHLIVADIKRTKKYIPSVLISVIVLLIVCSVSAVAISKHIYKEGIYSAIRIAYYIPEDSDKKYNEFALGILQDMQSMQDTAVLIPADTIEDGYKMVDDGDVKFFIIIPPNFFSGIMDSTNPSMGIVVKDHSSVTTYITYELFMAYAGYLGTAQAAIYSGFDVGCNHQYSDDEIDQIQDSLNIVFLDKTVSKESFMNFTECTNEGSYTLDMHYIASAVMLSLMLIAIVIMPLLAGHQNGLSTLMNVNGINNFHIYLSNVISTFICLYIAFIPCFAAVSIATKRLHAVGIVSILPYIFIISLIIAFIAFLGRNNIFTGNMIALFVTILLAYIGGGIIPDAMLPSVIKNISNILPGRFLLDGIAWSLYG